MKRIWFDSGWLRGIAGILLIISLLGLSELSLDALDLNARMKFAKKLGNGINIGNSLDVIGLYTWKPDAEELEFETGWRNPPISGELFRALRQSGITTVRIPVSWNDHMDKNGGISPLWLDRVQQVVDEALTADLYVILNTHHEEWLDMSVHDTKKMEQMLKVVWKQLAKRFAKYPEQLLFEGMNEPRAVGTPEEWLGGTEEQHRQINRLNQIFVDTVRSTGGKNRTRYLLITPYCSNFSEDAIVSLDIPDRRCMVSLHYYQPYSFCQKENGESSWNPAWAEDMEEMIHMLSQIFLDKHVPVILTEIGCIDRDNIEDRAAWTAALISVANQNGIRCIWWDNGSSYKIVDRETGAWTCPEIGSVLLNSQ